MGLSGRVPGRVDETTKAGLLALLDKATHAGWSWRGACREPELGEVRAYRWLERRAAGELADRRPGGSPMHGLLEHEVAEIVALYHSGARSTARIASSPTGAPTPIGCGSRPPRCDASWLLRG